MPDSTGPLLPQPNLNPPSAAAENTWRGGKHSPSFPPAELTGAPVSRVVEVLRADQRDRWRAGERVPAEVYLALHPALQRDSKAGFELVFGEILLREQLGEVPILADYERRFPGYADRLRRQLEVHRGLAPAPANTSELTILDPSANARKSKDEDAPRRPTVPGYEVLEQLGRGGMGVVYKARDVRLKRLVALKMMREGAERTPDERTRFRAEAEAVARLQHPHIVQIYEVGEADGRPFLALEFVEGGSLAERLTGQPLPAHLAAQLMATVARAVHAAHQQGIVHRDLKPGNILLQEDLSQRRKGAKEDQEEKAGASSSSSLRSSFAPLRLCESSSVLPKITDFGLAKHLHGEPLPSSSLTQTGEILGTPSYMAPEQASGRGAPIGQATDVYALGTILYELLTGRPPFVGVSAVETLLLVRQEEPVPPRRLQPNVPRDLETICLECLHKEPGRRYGSALALAEDLERFLQGETIRARPTSSGERALKWARRRPAVAALSTLSVLLTLLGFGLVLWQWREAEAARQVALAKTIAETAAKEDALAAKAREETQRQRAEAALVQINKSLYVHLLAAADREWLTGDAPRALQLLGECPPALRQWEWHYLRRHFEGSLFTLNGHRGSVNAVAFSPDDSRLASAGGDTTIGVWDTHPEALRGGKEPLLLRGHKASVVGVAFSPDGARLASASMDGTVRVWDAASGKELRAFTDPVLGFTAVAFSPDGSRLAAATRHPASDKVPCPVRVWDTTSGQELLTLNGHQGGVLGMAFNPDGRLLASGGIDRTVRIWDAAGGQQRLAFKEHGDIVTGVVFNSDGTRIASCGFDKRIKVWDPATGKEFFTCSGHTESVLGVAFSPDGQRLASAAWDRMVRVWNAANGQPLFTLQGHQGWAACVAFSPDGRRLASGAQDHLVKIWDATAGQQPLTLTGHKDWIPGLAFSPDSSRLATASGDQTVRLWDLATGQTVQCFQGQRSDVNHVAFSPDGKTLASAIEDHTVRLWDVATGQELCILRGHASEVRDVAYSPDGRYLASCGDDKSVRLWDVAARREVRSFAGHEERVTCVAFGPDGGVLVSGSADRTVRVWDVATGSERLVYRGHKQPVNSLAFRRDGRRLATADGNRDQPGVRAGVRVWDPTSGEEAVAFQDQAASVWSVAFSPDGERLVTGNDQGGVRIWEAATGQELLSLKWHRDDVRAVAFSPDGRLVVTTGDERVVQVWDATPVR
jgi:WD40 repeat protein/serine/threonine protein kinase